MKSSLWIGATGTFTIISVVAALTVVALTSEVWASKSDPLWDDEPEVALSIERDSGEEPFDEDLKAEIREIKVERTGMVELLLNVTKTSAAYDSDEKCPATSTQNKRRHATIDLTTRPDGYYGVGDERDDYGVHLLGQAQIAFTQGRWVYVSVAKSDGICVVEDLTMGLRI